MKKKKRTRQDVPDRSSQMEQAEGSRETVSESMRNRESSDLGSSSDRAMFTDRESAEARNTGSGQSTGSSERGAGSSGEPSLGTARELNIGSGGGPSGRGGREAGSTSERAKGMARDLNIGSGGGPSGLESEHGKRSGGITNRELDRELSEQEQLPERGRSQSER